MIDWLKLTVSRVGISYSSASGTRDAKRWYFLILLPEHCFARWYLLPVVFTNLVLSVTVDIFVKNLSGIKPPLL